MGAAYNDALSAEGAAGTFQWSIVSGALPSGLTLSATTGAVDGIPGERGEFAFVARVTSDTFFVDRSFALSVSAPQLAQQSVLDHLLGAGSLDADQQRFMDLQGNRNGRMDIGDVRAWLMSEGALAGTSMRKFLFILLLGGAAAIVCSEITAPPEPGTLIIQLTTPHADDAAILIRVAGPTAVVELTPATNAYVLHERAGQGGTRAVVFGTLGTGALATFEVPDVRRAAEYTATVLEVSGADNALRSDLGAHRLTVVR